MDLRSSKNRVRCCMKDVSDRNEATFCFTKKLSTAVLSSAFCRTECTTTARILRLTLTAVTWRPVVDWESTGILPLRTEAACRTYVEDVVVNGSLERCKACKYMEVWYTNRHWLKPVRIILCISCLCVSIGSLYYGPQILYGRSPTAVPSARSQLLGDLPNKALVDDELWTNSLAVDNDWTLEITWDRWPGSKVRSLLQDPDNIGSHRKFLKFFRNPEVAEFVRDYGARCSPNQRLYTWLFSAYHSIPAGFGSNINTALSNFVLVNEPEVRATHRFQFVEDKWLYAFLPNFFKDLGRTVNCPFFLDATRPPVRSTELRANVSFSRSNGVYIEAGRDVIMHHASVPWKRMLLAFTQLACRDGPDSIFKKKSAITKALWQPVKILEELLFLLWRQLAKPSGRFIGIHIRRGDKIGTEMEDISVASFMVKLREICPVPCPHKVFVMTDEDSSFEALLNLTSGTSYDVNNLQPLLMEIGLPASDYVVSSPNSVRSTPPTDRRFWTTSTKQLVLEITLLAMADQVICTMTSNICQLIALLKGSYEGSVHSLDLPWESVLF